MEVYQIEICWSMNILNSQNLYSYLWVNVNNQQLIIQQVFKFDLLKK